MVEVFFTQMLLVVFSQDLNFATQIIVWTLHKLVFAGIFVLLMILTKHASSTFVITVHDFEKTAFIMSLQILVHNDRVAFLVWADYFPERAILLVLFKILSFDDCVTAFFK